MKTYLISIYPPIAAGGAWLWVASCAGQWIDSGTQATEMGAVKQAAARLKQWADAQP